MFQSQDSVPEDGGLHLRRRGHRDYREADPPPSPCIRRGGGGRRGRGAAELGCDQEVEKDPEGEDDRHAPPSKGFRGSLPALHKAHEVQKRAARQGFDWGEIAPVLAKLEEELGELKEALGGG